MCGISGLAGLLFAMTLMLTILLSSSLHNCSALTASVRLKNGSSSSTSIIYPNTPAFAFANTSFEVVATVYVPTDTEMKTCTLETASSTTAESQIVFLKTSQITCSIWKWIHVCQQQGCSGILQFYDIDSVMFALDAQSLGHFSMVPNEPLRTSLPIVAMLGQGNSDADWLLSNLNAGNDDAAVLVHMSSDDVNPVSTILHTWYSKLNFGVAIFGASLNIVLALYKLWRHLVVAAATSDHRGASSKHKIPPTVAFVLVPEVVSNMCRVITAVHFSVLDAHLVSFDQMRLLFQTSLALAIGSTAALSMIVFNCLQSVQSQEKQERNRRILNGFAFSTATLVVLDILLAYLYIGPLRHVQFLKSATVITIYYVIVQIPVSIAFIRFKGRMVSLLHSVKNQLGPQETKRRERLSALVKLGGISMVFSTVTMVMVRLSIELNSVALLMHSTGLFHNAYNVMGTFQILSTRDPAPLQISSAAAVVPAVVGPLPKRQLPSPLKNNSR